jgi:microcystin-dependent protein
MSQPFIGEIRIFAGNFPPNGWMFCAGQVLPISENETLFNLIGTTYGGDGQETFALPNLASRVPVHQGNSAILAETGGVESVTLTQQQIPVHGHAPIAATTGQIASPANALLATASSAQAGVKIYSAAAPTVSMNPSSVSVQGGSQPHENMQPYLGLNFIISLFGIFPSQN